MLVKSLKKISLGTKIKSAIENILNFITSIFHTKGLKADIQVILEQDKTNLQTLEQNPEDAHVAKQTMEHLEDTVDVLTKESKENPELLAKEQEIQHLKQELEALKQKLESQGTIPSNQENVTTEQKVSILQRIQDDTSDSFIGNDILSLLRKQIPTVEKTDLGSSTPLIPGSLPPPPPPPPAPGLIPPPPPPPFAPSAPATKMTAKPDEQAKFNELIDKVFNFATVGQTINIEGLSESPVTVHTKAGFEKGKNALKEKLDKAKLSDNDKLKPIDNTLKQIEDICKTWLEQLPESLTVGEANELKGKYAADPISFFADAEKLKNQGLLKSPLLDQLEDVKNAFTDEYKATLVEALKQKEANSVLERKLNQLKLGFNWDKKSQLLDLLQKS